jgi:putative DNA primase/helicase
MRAFHFERCTGFGIIAGPVSGRRGAWDFDCPDTYRAFVAAAEASGLGAVVRRIEAGYCDETPAGGRRWIVHYPDTVEWRAATLARRPGNPGGPTIKTLIELPTFAILAPSHGPTHPSGRPYRRVSGGFAAIAAVTADEHADLVTLARTFDAPAAFARRGTPTDTPWRSTGRRVQSRHLVGRRARTGRVAAGLRAR